MPKKSWMTDADRAREGEKYRRASEAEREVEEQPIPEEHTGLDITKPTVEMMERLESDRDQPATIGDIVKLWERVSRFKEEEYSAKETTANQILAVAGTRPPNARFQSLESRMRIVWAVLVFLATLSLASVGAIAKYLYSSGGDERERSITIKNLVDHDADHEKRIRANEEAIQRDNYRLDDRYRAMPSGHQDTTPKGTTP